MYIPFKSPLCDANRGEMSGGGALTVRGATIWLCHEEAPLWIGANAYDAALLYRATQGRKRALVNPARA